MSPRRFTTAGMWAALRRVADADRRYPGEGYAWEDETWPPANADAEWIWLAIAEAERAIRSGREVKARLEALLLADVQTRGSVRFGDDVYYEGRDSKRRWPSEHGARILLEWIAEGAPTPADAAHRIDQAVRVDPTNVRLTWLRVEAGLRKINPDAVLDTFLTKEGDDTPTLSHHRTTLSTCPAWAKALQHGQRRAPRKAPKEDPDA
jgi:hypothetical protein